MESVFGLLGVILFIIIYFLPWIAASKKQHKNKEAIALVNLFLGWTLLGWFIALVWAATDGSKSVVVKKTDESSIDKLSKLSDLKEKGVLTDEEFYEQKKKILKEK